MKFKRFSELALFRSGTNYNVDVSGLTAPYRLRAEGTVGGRLYRLHSYAETADLGGNVNITPFTDLIVANAAQQIAESFFDSSSTTTLSPTALETQKTALKTKLQNVFSALGVSSSIDLLRTTFSADHSGLDAALDLVRIEVDTGTNIATIRNLIENTSISDNLLDDADNSETLEVTDSSALTTSVSNTQAIVNLFSSFSAAYSAGLPNPSTIQNLFSVDFIEEDTSRAEFLTDITTDPSLNGLEFSGISVSDLNTTLGTATVSFNVLFNGIIDPETITWFAKLDSTLGWQLLGDQRITETEFSFHCNDFDGTDGLTGGCGINTRLYDNDFTNNGTGGLEIASATVSVIDGNDASTVKAVVYLGTPSFASAGDVQVYDEGSQNFSGDYKGFGSAAGQILSSHFVAGDIIQYDLYTEDLNISNPSAPQIAANAQTVATYTDTLAYAPSTTGKYPVATTAAQSAISAFTLGSNLTLSWTLASGTRNDEVLVMVSDQIGNRLQTFVELIGSTENSVVIASTALEISSDSSSIGLDSTAASYQLLVRIYASDEITGQFHSTDYTATIPGPGDGGGTTAPLFDTTLICGYESGWNDLADGGLGAPITPNSFEEFETVLEDCGALPINSIITIAGTTVGSIGDSETLTFFNTGSGTVADPGTGDINSNEQGEPPIQFNWYVENASCSGCTHSYLVLFTDSTIAPDLPAGYSVRETIALKAIVGTPNAAGTRYDLVRYSEASNYGDM